MVNLGFSFYITVYQPSEEVYIPDPSRLEAMWKQGVLPCIRGLGRVYHRCLLKQTNKKINLVMWPLAPSEDPLKLLVQDNGDYFPSVLGSDTQARMQFPKMLHTHTDNSQHGQLQDWA